MIKEFMERNYRHFNAHTMVRAAKAYSEHIDSGGKMIVTLAGAMSTAELGISLAEMIRQGKVHAISCTGANLEEDLFNLVAHDHYEKIDDFRSLSEQDELNLLEKGFNRVTDTCIPEEEAMRRVERVLYDHIADCETRGERHFPHEYLLQLIQKGVYEKFYQIDPKDSWLIAAGQYNIPIFVPGWEDSTLGNIFTSYIVKGKIKSPQIMKSGIEYMLRLMDWYLETSAKHEIGFFQVGGGIAGDFPICVVPMLSQDLLKENVPLWSYFCQISDSTTSYGSYSGAVPNEKITWGKLGVKAPKFIVESDATIVCPLIFGYVLGQ